MYASFSVESTDSPPFLKFVADLEHDALEPLAAWQGLDLHLLPGPNPASLHRVRQREQVLIYHALAHLDANLSISKTWTFVRAVLRRVAFAQSHQPLLDGSKL